MFRAIREWKTLTAVTLMLCTGSAASATEKPHQITEDIGMTYATAFFMGPNILSNLRVYLHPTTKGFWITGNDNLHDECRTQIDDRLAHRLSAIWRQASRALDADNAPSTSEDAPLHAFYGYDYAVAKAFVRPDWRKYDNIAAETADQMMRALLRYCQKPGVARHEEVERYLLDLQNDIRPPGYGFVPHKDTW